MLKVKDIFDVHCLKLWYEFVNNEMPYFLFRDNRVRGGVE